MKLKTQQKVEPHSGRERDTSELELFTLMVLFALISVRRLEQSGELMPSQPPTLCRRCERVHVCVCERG
jgi:hypothetical protein